MNHCKSIHQRTQATSHGGALRNAASIDAKSVVPASRGRQPQLALEQWLAATLREAPLRLHVCLLCARGTGRVSQPRACREARGQAERTVSAEPSVSSTPVRVVNSSRLSCFVAYLVAYSSAVKCSMSGLRSTLARCEIAARTR